MAMSGSAAGNRCLDLESYIDCAHYLIRRCRKLADIPGAQKLEKKCCAELKYLQSLSRRRHGYERSHLRSSNLSHYLGIVQTAQHLPGVTHILQAFPCPGRSDALHVDVVAGQGHVWVKVIARKAQALHLIWAGQGQYGDRDASLQAEDFVTCSKVHTVNYVEPTVVFAFYNGVTDTLATALEDTGVVVVGDLVPVSNNVLNKLNTSLDDNLPDDDEDGVSDSEEEQNFSVGLEQNCGKQTTFYVNPFDKNVDVDVGQYQIKKDAQTVETSELGDIQTRYPELDIVVGKLKDLRVSDDVLMTDDVETDGDIVAGEIIIEADVRTKKNPEPAVESIDMTVDKQVISESGKGEKESKILRVQLQSSSFEPGVDKRKEPYHTLDVGKGQVAEYGRENKIGENLSKSEKEDEVLQKSVVHTERPLDSLTSYDCTTCDTQPRISDNNNGRTQDEALVKVQQMGNLPPVIHEILTSPVVNFTKIFHILNEMKPYTVELIPHVNLDVTALITLVSSVSHGGCHFKFKEKILTEQATEERRDPVLPKLQSFLKGKQLLTCESAMQSFLEILDTLGGASERSRAGTLLEQVTVVKDNPSFRTNGLPKTAKIKERSKVIFGTGDSLQAVTVTANSGFVRAAEHQGVMYTVFLHASRALTESKELTAEALTKDSQ